MARAAAISAGSGMRPSRATKPQHRDSGVVVMSKAPSVRSQRSRAHASSANSSSATRTGASAARRLTIATALSSR
jgi:hypothetical protein